MNVWVTVTKKRVPCKHCEKLIETGQYQVVCQYFMKLRNGKTWTKKMHFHAKEPNCWLDRAIAEIESRPVIETRGAKRSMLSDVAREKREKILRRRASVMQRISLEMGGRMRACKLSHMIEMLGKLAVEIEPYGGVPKTWR